MPSKLGPREGTVSSATPVLNHPIIDLVAMDLKISSSICSARGSFYGRLLVKIVAVSTFLQFSHTTGVSLPSFRFLFPTILRASFSATHNRPFNSCSPRYFRSESSRIISNSTLKQLTPSLWLSAGCFSIIFVFYNSLTLYLNVRTEE